MKEIQFFVMLSTLLTVLPSCSTTNRKVVPNNTQEEVFNKIVEKTRSIDDFDSIIVQKNDSPNTLTKVDYPADIEVPLARPALDLNGIKNLLQTYAADFDACYLDGLANASYIDSYNGKLFLKFKINKIGKVINSEINSLDFESFEVKECIRNTLNEIKFPESDRVVAINQTINLNYKIK